MLSLTVLAGMMASTVHAGLRVYDASSGQNVAPAVTAPASAPAKAPEAQPPEVKAAPAPVTAIPAPQISAPVSNQDESRLGTALVFIKSIDFSEVIASKIKEIARVPGLDVRFYLQDESPRALVALAKGTLKNMPQGVDFNIDLDSRMAQSHGVVGQNMIVYRDPSGAVRHYNLVSEYANFLNHVNRLRSR